VKPALLDINVLVALFNPDHIHHDVAHDWFSEHSADGWATCPITENGFLRVLSNPKAVANAERPSVLAALLARFRASRDHVFWPDAVSLCDQKLFNRSFLVGPRQLTDVYLVGLAKMMGGTLATFDRTIPIGAVVGATKATLRVITPASED
jgi:toxin-antitoxin system PIN domain toxin